MHSSHSVGIRQTEALIARDTTQTVVIRRSLQATAAGGRKHVVTDQLDPQAFRFTPARTINSQQALRVTEDGRQLLTDWHVICMPDADIQIGDILAVDDKRYEVTFQTTTPSWRKVMEVHEDV